MNSKVEQKLTEGYFKTKEEAEEETVILPMLAKSYNDHSSKIDWNTCVYIQPKLDGMRCLAIIKNGQVTLKSRDGKVIENMMHIVQELTGLEDQILDGELYAHELSFQENMKLIKKYRPNETENIKYHVYDWVDNTNFINRYEKLQTLIESNNFEHVLLVSTRELNDEAELSTAHSSNLYDKYEGSIIRHGSKPYGMDKRCDSLLKYKDFQDIDAKLIDIEPAEQRPEWGVPVLEYNGKTFRSGIRMSHDDRKDMLINKQDYLGKTAEIRFFEFTDDGLPRFPVMVGIRLDK
jgi:DNA ligase 1